MYLFTIIATPKPDNLELFDVGGAYVNAWVFLADEDEAERLARSQIDDCGWTSGRKTKVSWYEEAGEVSEEDRDYFSEAIKCGYSLVFNQWPVDATDADVDHDIN